MSDERPHERRIACTPEQLPAILAHIERIKAAQRGPSFRVSGGYMTFTIWDLTEDEFIAIRRAFRGWGWWVGKDPMVSKDYPSISKWHYLVAKGLLRATLRWAPAYSTFEFYSDHVPGNIHGPRYVSKHDRIIDSATARLYRLTVRKLREWAIATGRADKSEPVFTTPGENVEFHRRSGWHYDSDVHNYNRKDADGVLMTDGDVRWFYDYRDHLRSGTAYHNINSMWWVVSGAERLNIPAHELFAPRPGMPRRKRDPEHQRRRLEDEKKKAVEGENYERAALLRDLLRRAP